MNADKMSATEAYAQCYRQIDQVVTRFRHKYQWDKDWLELRADANTAFMQCYNHWEDGHRGDNPDFQYSVRRWVWMYLFDQYRAEVHTKKRGKAHLGEREDENSIPTNDARFVLGEFLEELPADARKVATLVLEPPAFLTKRVDNRGGRAMNWRSCLREHLRSLGWNNKRISKSFAVIGAVV